jgi:hypothetical protein
MMPKNTAPKKEGQERPLPVTSTAIEEIPVAISMAAPDGFLGIRENPNGVHAAKSTAHDEDSKSSPIISIKTDHLTSFEDDDSTRFTNSDDDTSKRKASSIHMRTDMDNKPRTKRLKNKQNSPAMSDDQEDNPSNDEDRKPAAKDTTTPTPDGVPSTRAGFKRKSTSPYTGSVLSTSGQRIKLEPIIKTETEAAIKTETEAAPTNTTTSAREIKREPVVKVETSPASAPANPSNDRVEAPIPTEPVRNGPNLNRTVTVRRKAAKRTDLEPPPQSIAVPLLLSPSPQAEEIPAMKKPRVEEPLPTTTDEAAREIASPDVSETLPSPDTPSRSSTTPVNVSTRRRSQRQIQLQLIEASATQLDDDGGDCDGDYVDNDDDDDLSSPAPTTTAPATMRTSIRRPSSRHLISISTAGTRILPKRQCQTKLPSIETSEAKLDDDDGNGDGDGDLSGPSWEDRLSELAEYRTLHGNCNVPYNYSDNTKLGTWVSTQRKNYRFHLEEKISSMTLSRIEILESLGFKWDSYSAAWKDRLSELAEFRKIHGHCNVPKNYSGNSSLYKWVQTQRSQYKLHLKGKRPHMTNLRIQELDSLGFEWNSQGAGWEARLSELAEYRNIQGHCNVPRNGNQTTKLATWVRTQRSQYKLRLKGMRSRMTPFRIQELEGLGFEWKPSIGRR